jgi:hypothetical protein
MVQNWPTYESFIRKYVHKSISFDRFASEIVDQINKNTSPVQILDHIGQLRTASGTGQTINNPIPAPVISPTLSKPVPSKPGSAPPLIDPFDNVIDPHEKDAKTVAELEKEIASLEETPEIKSFLQPKSNFVAIQKIGTERIILKLILILFKLSPENMELLRKLLLIKVHPILQK